jgi:hypothetical protein
MRWSIQPTNPKIAAKKAARSREIALREVSRQGNIAKFRGQRIPDTWDLQAFEFELTAHEVSRIGALRRPEQHR